ncbi:MAG: GyrI-like domain-containing protein [Bryobacterales bacterium]|nr:GyrI-like domain-containing protein [Bryobacterales bacterium]
MRKIDLKKDWKQFYTASARRPSLVDVPKRKYLMLDGQGDPDTNPDFQRAIEALYSVAYTLKFTLKMGPEQIDYPVMALDCLWWSDTGALSETSRTGWKWTLMIAQPDVITAAMVRAAKKKAKEKKGLACVDNLRLESWREGKAVQMMHIGPYSEEERTIGKMQEFAAAQGYQLTGKHHEIYFSDPRRTKPEKLKTLLRRPICR